ncbi:type II toxin-antitoxin system HicB family antitoxin [Paenibacillus luteus]|uniref:type II toxin-antitoxin system HicB family antitoxin n=1 Tax=Paenibacillus luteus TaxID=2545753 RepID=UPI001F4F1571|nr:type II toxin-antitoxin system HicB family antitoxin [Paenibacillus luteus]
MPKLMENKKNLDYYLALPYTFQVRQVKDDDKSYYWANVKELDGCHTSGETREQAFNELQEVLKDHIEIKLEYGDPIPEPQEDFSGKILVRVPKSLHRQLIFKAEEEGISLNQYMLYKLSK